MTDEAKAAAIADAPGRSLTSHDAGFRDDPQPRYDALRAAGGLVANRDYGCLIVTDYRRVQAALKHKAFSVDATRAAPDSYMRRVAGTGVRESQGDSAYEPPLVLLDDPTHRRVRQLVSKAFNPAVIEAMTPKIEAITRRLLEELGDRRDMDFIGDFAGPLPTMVILEMLGMPLAHAADFKQWSEDILWGYDPERGRDRQRRLRDAYLHMSSAFREAIDARRHGGARQGGGSDLISRMLRRDDDGDDQLSELQIISLCTQLMVAGNVTTTDLMGNGLYALLTHPEELRWLRDHPEALEAAVEEMLRFDCPITETARIPTADTRLEGCPVAKGDTLMLSLAAANHDPERYHEPHALKLRRPSQTHVAFGSGLHVCLGAPLARLETRIAFREFLTRYPAIDLHPGRPPQRRHLPFFRGFETLPLQLPGTG